MEVGITKNSNKIAKRKQKWEMLAFRIFLECMSQPETHQKFRKIRNVSV